MKNLFLFVLMTAAALAETKGSWTGIVTDSMCLKDHAMMSGQGSDDNCVRACVKTNPASYKYVLFDGKNTYKLSNQELPAQYAARKVVVKGTLFVKTGIIKVDSIHPAH